MASREPGEKSVVVDAERASFLGNTSTMGIVAGVLLALVMVAGEQVAERVDTIVFAGIFPVFGIMVHLICNLTATITYGWVSGMIVANVNPIVAVATATGPLAPLWFVTNTVTTTGARIVQYYMIRKGPRELNYWEMLAISFGGMLPNAAVMFPVQLLYFKMPWDVISYMVLAELVVGTFIPAYIALKSGQALKRTRVA